MKKYLLIAAGLLAASIPALAHHSFAAEYDGNKPVTLKGKLTEFEWVNPHSWVHLDVTDDKGNTVNWTAETAPPNILYRQGWRRDSIKPGDDIVVEGYLAKDGSHTVSAKSVQTAEGKKLLAGTPTDGSPSK
jgi:hypothetical protein